MGDFEERFAALKAEESFLEGELITVKEYLAEFAHIQSLIDNPLVPLRRVPEHDEAGNTAPSGEGVRRSPLVTRAADTEQLAESEACEEEQEPSLSQAVWPDYDPDLIDGCESYPEACEVIALAHDLRMNPTNAAKAIKAAGMSEAEVRDISSSITTTLRNKPNWKRNAPGDWTLLSRTVPQCERRFRGGSRDASQNLRIHSRRAGC